MVARYKTKKTGLIQNPELSNLKAFYNDHVKLRLLDSQHLMKEIDHQLTRKLNEGRIDKELYLEYKEKAESNISELEPEVVEKQEN